MLEILRDVGNTQPLFGPEIFKKMGAICTRKYRSSLDTSSALMNHIVYMYGYCLSNAQYLNET